MQGQMSEHRRALPVMELNSPHPTLLPCDSSLYHQDAVRGKGGVRMHFPTFYPIVAYLVGPTVF